MINSKPFICRISIPKDNGILVKCGTIILTYKNVKVFLALCIVCLLITIVHITSSRANEPAQASQLKVDVTLASQNSGYADNSAELRYGVVIDCGSSGSRVYVYCWPPHHGGATELLNIQQLRDGSGRLVMKKIEPGLSELKDTPAEAGRYLRPLLDFASAHVPTAKHSETPLYVMATAGLRMLTQRYCFKFNLTSQSKHVCLL